MWAHKVLLPGNQWCGTQHSVIIAIIILCISHMSDYSQCRVTIIQKNFNWIELNITIYNSMNLQWIRSSNETKLLYYTSSISLVTKFYKLKVRSNSMEKVCYVVEDKMASSPSLHHLFLLRMTFMATSSLVLWSKHFRTCPKDPFPITSSTSKR